MWQRGWRGANLSVVSHRGRGCNARGMGGRFSRGGTHSSTALKGSRGSDWRRGGSGTSWWRHGSSGSSWVEAAGRGRGRTAHPGPESASSASLKHARAREGEEMKRGETSELETGCEMKRKERKGVF